MDDQVEDSLQPETQQENQTLRPAPSEPKQPPNNMATASLVMGILAVVTCCCYYVSIIFSGLGILFALLSRTEEHMRGSAKAGMALSIAGLVLMAAVWGAVLAGGLYNNFFSDSPIQNLPVIPDITQPGTDNLLTVFRRLPMGGGIR